MKALCPHGQIVAGEALKAKYPHACHAPLTDCPLCLGLGERWLEGRALVQRSILELGTLPAQPAMWWPCTCLIVGHDLVTSSALHLQAMADTVLKQVRAEEERKKP